MLAAGIGGHGREITGARFRDLRARRHEVLEILRDVLVIDIQLFFERVELRLIEHLPPFAFEHRVLRAWRVAMRRAELRCTPRAALL